MENDSYSTSIDICILVIHFLYISMLEWISMTQPFSNNLQYHAKSFFFPSLCSLRFNNINRKNVISFFPLKSLNNFSPLPHLTGSHLSWRSVKLLPYKSFYVPVRAQYQSMFNMKETFWLKELFIQLCLRKHDPFDENA